ncbi:MAG: bleomycin resistance protein [Ruminococcus sp.]|nr:bleomycin resistance protein [Ruminococcus sp.]
MENKTGRDRIVKIGIVVDDIEEAAKHYNAIFDLKEEAVVRYPDPDRRPVAGAYKKMRGETVNPKLKSLIVNLEPIYLEVLEPADDEPSPWREYLEKHGPGVCFISFYIDGFEEQVDLMEKGGYPMSFVEEKMFERYAYFETQGKLGVTVEFKERKPREI